MSHKGFQPIGRVWHAVGIYSNAAGHPGRARGGEFAGLHSDHCWRTRKAMSLSLCESGTLEASRGEWEP